MSAALEALGASKSYGTVVGIDGLDLSVTQGEIFGFLGPNGAGKTTTIRLFMQMLSPDRGRLTVLGEALDRRRSQLHERIGYLPGEFRPYPEMSGARFLAYMSRYRSRPPRLRSMLSEQLGLTQKDIARRIKYLSHGNRQKLGILLALEHDPDLAILDEPTLGLDPLVQESFYEILRGLRDRGTTIFLSSHLLAEVEKICSRVAIVREGRLVAVESIEALKWKRPRRLILMLGGEASEAPGLPGARLISREDARCVYLLEGDVRAALQALTTLPVQDVYLPEPDLDEVFMAYYRAGEA